MAIPLLLFVVALAAVSAAGLIWTPLVVLVGTAVVLGASGWVLVGTVGRLARDGYGDAGER